MNAVNKTITKILNSIVGILLFAVSLAAFDLPYEVGIITEVKAVLPYVQYACGGLLIIAFFVLYASSLRVFRDNWYFWASCLFIGILIYSTWINNTSMSDALGNKGLAALFAVMNIAVFFKVNPKKFMLIAFFMFLAVNIANTYCIFRYWGVGLWEEWKVYKSELISIVGNYNGGVEYVLPMAICGSAYAHRYGKWMEFVNYPAMIMSIIMAIKCDSETQIMVFAVIILFMILGDLIMISDGFARVVRWIFNPAILIAAEGAAYTLILWLNKTELIAKLGIDTGFHGRRHIWDMAIYWIRQKPVWGNGMETVLAKSLKIVGYAHCHSWLMEIPYMTGIVGSAAAFLMIAATAVVLFRSKNNRAAFILSGMTFALILTNMFETYGAVFPMMAMALIYYLAQNLDAAPSKHRRKKRLKQ